MAEQIQTTQQRQGGTVVSSHKGSEVGKDAKYDEMRRKSEQQAFDAEMGWAGIANAGKKPRGADYEARFEEWRKKRAAKAGQAKAVAATGSTP